MSSSSVVYVVDDDAGMRDLLRRLLVPRFAVELFGSARNFLSAFDPGRVSCLVLDLRMNGMTGIELIERLRADGGVPPVIVLTGFGEVESAVRAMKLGAFEYLEKPPEPAVFVSRVSEAIDFAGREVLRRRVTRLVVDRLGRLTLAERQVLRLILTGRTSEEIAIELHRSSRTIENHRFRILRKLGARNTIELAGMAMLAQFQARVVDDDLSERIYSNMLEHLEAVRDE